MHLTECENRTKNLWGGGAGQSFARSSHVFFGSLDKQLSYPSSATYLHAKSIKGVTARHAHRLAQYFWAYCTRWYIHNVVQILWNDASELSKDTPTLRCSLRKWGWWMVTSWISLARTKPTRIRKNSKVQTCSNLMCECINLVQVHCKRTVSVLQALKGCLETSG